MVGMSSEPPSTLQPDIAAPDRSPPIDRQSTPHTQDAYIPRLCLPGFIWENRPRRRQGELHLVPCTREQFLELDSDIDGRYELVEGILVSYPMADAERQEIARYWHHRLLQLHAKKQAHIIIGLEVKLEIPSAKRALKQSTSHLGSTSRRGSSPLSDHSSERSSSSSSSPSSSSEEDSVRKADIVIGRYRGKDELKNASPSSGKIPYRLGKDPPLMVIEITSPSTRREDLDKKWIEYARAGINEYVIIDRGITSAAKHSTCTESMHQGCVIVGVLSESDAPVHTGNPEVAADQGLRRTKRKPLPTASAKDSRVYTRKVYRGSEKVHCSYFGELSATANDMLDPPLAEEIARRDQERIDEALASKDAALASKDAALASKDEALASKDAALASKDRQNQLQAAEILELKRQLERSRQGKGAKQLSSATRSPAAKVLKSSGKSVGEK